MLLLALPGSLVELRWAIPADKLRVWVVILKGGSGFDNTTFVPKALLRPVAKRNFRLGLRGGGVQMTLTEHAS